MHFCWQDEISVSEKEKKKVKLHSLIVHIFKSWGIYIFSLRRRWFGGENSLFFKTPGWCCSGILVEKLLLSSCFLLSIEIEILWFCHSNNLSLSSEMHPKIWLCSEILISIFFHASCFDLFCKPVVTATSVGSGLYCILKKSHWLQADWSSWPDICQKYI